MGVLDNLSWALRHCRKRLFESILIIFAIGLGVAVIVAILALIVFARDQLQLSYEHEGMRTFRVYSAAHFSMSTGQEPILRVVQERPSEPLQVSLDELKDLQDSLPSGMHVFAQLSMSFPSRLLPKPTSEAEGTSQGQYEAITPYRMIAPGSAPLVVSRSDTVMTIDGGVVETPLAEGEVEAEDETETLAPEPSASGAQLESKSIATLDSFSDLLAWREQYECIDVVGATLSYFDFKQYRLAQGSLFVEDDIANANLVMVLSNKLAERIFGDSNPVGKTVPILDTTTQQELFYTVIGVFAPVEDEDIYAAAERYFAYVPYTAMPLTRAGAAGGEIVLDNFVIGVDKGMKLTKAAEIIQNEIMQRYGELGTVDNTYIHLTSALRNNFSLYIIIAIFACLGLIIAVINILNLMLARMLRRTKSIGLSMALGSSKEAVFRQFLLEATALGLTGAVLGIGLGFILVKEVVIALIRADVPFGPEVVAAGCGLGLLVSLLFGVYPAYQGAAVNPVDALRNE